MTLAVAGLNVMDDRIDIRAEAISLDIEFVVKLGAGVSVLPIAENQIVDPRIDFGGSHVGIGLPVIKGIEIGVGVVGVHPSHLDVMLQRRLMRADVIGIAVPIRTKPGNRLQASCLALDQVMDERIDGVLGSQSGILHVPGGIEINRRVAIFLPAVEIVVFEQAVVRETGKIAVLGPIIIGIEHATISYGLELIVDRDQIALAAVGLPIFTFGFLAALDFLGGDHRAEICHGERIAELTQTDLCRRHEILNRSTGMAGQQCAHPLLVECRPFNDKTAVGLQSHGGRDVGSWMLRCSRCQYIAFDNRLDIDAGTGRAGYINPALDSGAGHYGINRPRHVFAVTGWLHGRHSERH